MKSFIVNRIPKRLLPSIKGIYYYPLEKIESWLRGNNMVPPRSKIFIGAGDFVAIGKEFLQHFQKLTTLTSASRVLDVGCGIGRMAIPLTDYLSHKGEYWGFDISKADINWCRNRISSNFSHFNFHHCDVFNKHYNHTGHILPKDYQFPYRSDFFDLSYQTSVFTHMYFAELENYLTEISRVLKPGGQCLSTFFLINQDSQQFIESGQSTRQFIHQVKGGGLTDNPQDPESAIAFEEAIIFQLFKKHGFSLNHGVQYGSWCGRSKFLSYQDILVATKKK